MLASSTASVQRVTCGRVSYNLGSVSGSEGAWPVSTNSCRELIGKLLYAPSSKLL